MPLEVSVASLLNADFDKPMKELLLLRCHNAKRRGSVVASPPPPAPPKAARKPKPVARPSAAPAAADARSWEEEERKVEEEMRRVKAERRDAAAPAAAPAASVPKGKRGASKPMAAPLSLAVQLQGGGTAQLELPPVVTEATLRDALAEIETRRAASPPLTNAAITLIKAAASSPPAKRPGSTPASPFHAAPAPAPAAADASGWEEEGRRVESEMRRVEEERRFVKELEGIGSAMAPASEPPATPPLEASPRAAAAKRNLLGMSPEAAAGRELAEQILLTSPRNDDFAAVEAAAAADAPKKKKGAKKSAAPSKAEQSAARAAAARKKALVAQQLAASQLVMQAAKRGSADAKKTLQVPYRRAARTLQSCARRWLARRNLERRKRVIVRVQAAVRAWLGRARARRRARRKAQAARESRLMGGTSSSARKFSVEPGSARKRNPTKLGFNVANVAAAAAAKTPSPGRAAPRRTTPGSTPRSGTRTPPLKVNKVEDDLRALAAAVPEYEGSLAGAIGLYSSFGAADAAPSTAASKAKRTPPRKLSPARSAGRDPFGLPKDPWG